MNLEMFRRRDKSVRIAIVGAGGQLGTDLVRVLAEFELFPLFYPDFDITKKGYPHHDDGYLSRHRHQYSGLQ